MENYETKIDLIAQNTAQTELGLRPYVEMSGAVMAVKMCESVKVQHMRKTFHEQ